MGTMFTPVQVEITSYEPERVGGQYCIIRIPAKTADTKRWESVTFSTLTDDRSSVTITN